MSGWIPEHLHGSGGSSFQPGYQPALLLVCPKWESSNIWWYSSCVTIHQCQWQSQVSLWWIESHLFLWWYMARGLGETHYSESISPQLVVRQSNTARIAAHSSGGRTCSRVFGQGQGWQQATTGVVDPQSQGGDHPSLDTIHRLLSMWFLMHPSHTRVNIKWRNEGKWVWEWR